MKHLGAIAATILLSGCMVAQPLSGRGILVLKPQITVGSLSTNTVLSPYTQASINHLILKLYTYNGSEHDQGIQKSIPNADLAKSITFSNLKANTTYRIKANAYFTSDESQLISTTDANSYTDITLVTDDHPSFANLKVKLIDQPFNGQGTGSLQITNGGYNYSASESCGVPFLSAVFTLAGNRSNAFADGNGTAASFGPVYDIVFDSTSGMLYVADGGSNRIRKVSLTGVVTTLAGNGNASYADGVGTSASFQFPTGVAVDNGGNVYVADNTNNRIRKIDTNGVVTTIAGNGSASYADGTGTSAMFNHPWYVAVDNSGNLFVADTNNNRIRKITSSGVVTTLAGNGNAGAADGTGTAATFNGPNGLRVDNSGNLYVADWYNHRIRKITSTGVVTTFAGNGTAGATDGTGTAATLNAPNGIGLDPQGNVYIADEYNNRIRKITPAGVVTTIAGSGGTAFANGTGTAATFKSPQGVTMDAYGMLYVADTYNYCIRAIH